MVQRVGGCIGVERVGGCIGVERVGGCIGGSEGRWVYRWFRG